MLFVKSLQSPNLHFDIQQYIQFATNNTTFTLSYKLSHRHSHLSVPHHFYFTRIVCLWNHLPAINISLPSQIIKYQLLNYLWTKFQTNFNSNSAHTFHLLCPCHQCSSMPTTIKLHNLTDFLFTNS